jgi:2,4-dienoyl-CoA reductase-like NADH-dependent reductase (Old Yellow Enzyme family)
MWNGALIGGASLDVAQAEAEIDAGLLDAVTWGRAFIANPDLAKKIEQGSAWVPFQDEMRETLV